MEKSDQYGMLTLLFLVALKNPELGLLFVMGTITWNLYFIQLAWTKKNGIACTVTDTNQVAGISHMGENINPGW